MRLLCHVRVVLRNRYQCPMLIEPNVLRPRYPVSSTVTLSFVLHFRLPSRVLTQPIVAMHALRHDQY